MKLYSFKIGIRNLSGQHVYALFNQLIYPCSIFLLANPIIANRWCTLYWIQRWFENYCRNASVSLTKSLWFLFSNFFFFSHFYFFSPAFPIFFISSFCFSLLCVIYFSFLVLKDRGFRVARLSDNERSLQTSYVRCDLYERNIVI